MEISEWKALVRAARPFYTADGANGWSHIRAVMRQGEHMIGATQHRSLTAPEVAAVLFHDSAVKELGKKHHAERGAVLAATVLFEHALLSEEEIAEVAKAIAEHDSKEQEKSTDLSDFLASADFSPMDIVFIAKKSLDKNYQRITKQYGENEANWRQAAVAASIYVNEAYGLCSNRLFPRLYQNFYKDQIASVRLLASKLDYTAFLSLIGKEEWA